LPSSIGPRNRAPLASPSIRTSSPRWPKARAEGTSPFAAEPRVVGGRYGLSSKEFTPAMVKAVFDNLAEPRSRNHFTIGINDDITRLSLPYDATFEVESSDVTTAIFYGLGADGTVGANKNSIKIIGTETDAYVQGYFVYDSKKSGATTISHLRTGPRPIRSAYLIQQARFVACHQFEFVDRIDVLEHAAGRSGLPSECTGAAEEVWSRLPQEVQATLIAKRIQFYAIDAASVAREAGMGGRINTIMQTCFFAISGALPPDEAIRQIKKAIEKTYRKRGPEVVKRNCDAVDLTLAHLHRITVPEAVTATYVRPPMVSPAAPDLVQRVTATLLAGKGDQLPVSAFPVDGTWPMGTGEVGEAESRDRDSPCGTRRICIQCNQCVLVCPHAAIRAKVYEGDTLARRPGNVQGRAVQRERVQGPAVHHSSGARGLHRLHALRERLSREGPDQPEAQGHRHGAAGADPRGRTGELRVLSRAARSEAGQSRENRPQDVAVSRAALRVLGSLRRLRRDTVHQLLTQLFGDRALIANATGCSSIYGGNLPTTPYTTNREGRGPAWANSLFEDNAEFGLGMRLGVDSHAREALALVAAGAADWRPSGGRDQGCRSEHRGGRRRPARARAGLAVGARAALRPGCHAARSTG
jgi:pyruvate-ferredoxin/flavodoxin oxidoreductase